MTSNAAPPIGIHSEIWTGGALTATIVFDIVTVATPFGIELVFRSPVRLTAVLVALVILIVDVVTLPALFWFRRRYNKDRVADVKGVPTERQRRLYSYFSIGYSLSNLGCLFLWIFVSSLLFRVAEPPAYLTGTWLGDAAFTAWLMANQRMHFITGKVFEMWSPAKGVPDNIVGDPNLPVNKSIMALASITKGQFILFLVVATAFVGLFLYTVPVFWSNGPWWWIQIIIVWPSFVWTYIVGEQTIGNSVELPKYIEWGRIGGRRINPEEFNTTADYAEEKRRTQSFYMLATIPGIVLIVLNALFVLVRLVFFSLCSADVAREATCVYPLLLGDGLMLVANAIIVVLLVGLLLSETGAYKANHLGKIYEIVNSKNKQIINNNKE